MVDLQTFDGKALYQPFGDMEDPKSVKRLMVALAYTDGVSVGRISDRYGIPEQTCYAWLNRLTDRSLEAAITDETSSGRPSKLDEVHLGPVQRVSLVVTSEPRLQRR